MLLVIKLIENIPEGYTTTWLNVIAESIGINKLTKNAQD